MNAMIFLVSTLFKLYLMVVLLRFWLQSARADFYNPFSQFVVKATQPILKPMRRILPSMGKIDTSSLVLALIISYLFWTALVVLQAQPFDPLLTLYLSGLTVIKEFGTLVFWILLLRAILSWVSQGASPVERVMHQLTEPFLAPIRRMLPDMGGLDLSVLVVFLGLNFINILLGDFVPLWRIA
ncbi:YggT family protein [Ferrimonas lipolytica]|uniref:YggT family protein n=1 Tax=Ferrimonas lipolytica TaxID=2724191 RepID=A0A6H1UD43_9GAMM|nr:YggT family protein [Ferrimonas lipolytica]QIZ75722.1 YggT family protein [Ferrimonas lipolytica]